MDDTPACSPYCRIAEYKIIDIADDKVTFFFNDLVNDKKKTYITMPSKKFISHILIHLPPKNFKMVNRYGFYSRHISERQLMLSGKTLPCQDIHFIKGRCTRLSGPILFTVQYARLKWLYGNSIITGIQLPENIIIKKYSFTILRQAFLYLLKVSYNGIMNTRGEFMRKVYTECPVEYTVSIIANKWKTLILKNLLLVN